MYLLLLLLVVVFFSSSIRFFPFTRSRSLSICGCVVCSIGVSSRAFFLPFFFRSFLLSSHCSIASLTHSTDWGVIFLFRVYPHPHGRMQNACHALHVCIRKKKSSSSIHTLNTHTEDQFRIQRETQPNSYIKPTCSYSRTAYILHTHTHTRRSFSLSLSQRNRNKT